MAGVFLALSCCASGGYVINDLPDLPHDRRHAHERDRPLAAGRVSALPAAALAAVLIAGGLLAAFGLSESAGGGLAAYVAGAPAYSLSLKQFVVVDVIALALLYGVRIAMGATESAALSPWLLFFSLFPFTSSPVERRKAHIPVILEPLGGRSSANRAHPDQGPGFRPPSVMVQSPRQVRRQHRLRDFRAQPPDSIRRNLC